jgi:mono/diheme cytochrome c family protein
VYNLAVPLVRAIGLLGLAGATAMAAQGGPYDRQKVDAAAATRGRAVYAQHCINCHGSTAKGTDRGPDLIRSVVVLRDRMGTGVGSALKSTAHQARLTTAQIVDLSHFLHQRIESIASNRTPRAPIDVLTGDPEAGRAYFYGAGTCSTCHSTTGDLAGIGTRIGDAVALQQRWLFPTSRRTGGRQADVMASGRSVSGTLVRLDDFSVTLRDDAGTEHSFTRGPNVTVNVRDPLAAHRGLLDRYTDTNMHDVTTYLWTLK